MAEKGMMFSTWSVQRLLANEKFCTRRLQGLEKINENPEEWRLLFNSVKPFGFMFQNRLTGKSVLVKPRYQPHDDVWVRETWQQPYSWHFSELLKIDPLYHRAIYKASPFDTWGTGYNFHWDDIPAWRPSIHMPKWAARLWLPDITVRCERLWDITPEDAKAEGDKERSGFPEYYEYGAYCHVHWFKSLWDSINPKYPWEKANWWVWRIGWKEVVRR